MKIPVVIFCGGKGTRMKEETEFIPKPMVTVGKKPILWHIMKIYSHYGYNDFIITLGYKGDHIKDYFTKKPDNFKITFVDTGQETLTAERLLKVKKYIKSDTLMATYGDGVGNIDIRKLVKYHKQKNTIGVITGVHPTSKWGLVIADKNNTVKRFQQKPRLNQYVNGGFMVFKYEFLQYANKGEMIEVALDRLVKKRELAVYLHDSYWSAVDTYQDLEELNRQWKKDPKWKVW